MGSIASLESRGGADIVAADTRHRQTLIHTASTLPKDRRPMSLFRPLLEDFWIPSSDSVANISPLTLLATQGFLPVRIEEVYRKRTGTATVGSCNC